MENAKERPTLQCCAKSQSTCYRLDIISGVVLKILSGYISVGTWSQVGWRPSWRRPFRRRPGRWAKAERREAQLTLAQTTLMMVGVSEIGGSRPNIGTLLPGHRTCRPREQNSGTSGCSMTHSPMTTIDDDRWLVGEGTFIFTLHD